MRFTILKKLFIAISVIGVLISCTSKQVKNAELEELLISVENSKFNDPQLAKKKAELLLQKSNTKKNNDYKFKALYLLAKIANINGNYNLGIDYSKQAEKIATSLFNNKLLCETYLVRGNSLIYLGEDDKSLTYYLKALDLAKEENDALLALRANANIAKIKRDHKLYKQALKIYTTNLKLVKDYQLEKDVIGINTYLGMTGTFLTLHAPDSTLFYARKGLEYSKNDKEGKSYFYIDIGIAYFIKGNLKKAIEYLKQAEQTIKELKNEKRLVEVYYYLGKSYAEDQDINKGIDFLILVEEIIQSENTKTLEQYKYKPHILLHTYDALTDLFRTEGNLAKENEYARKYRAIDKQGDIGKDLVFKRIYKNLDKKNIDLSHSTYQLKETLNYTLLIMLLILGCCCYFLYRFIIARKKNKLIFEQLMQKIEVQNLKKKKSNITIQDDKVASILKGLDKLETSLYFLNCNCTLQNVAKKVKTNTTYLSRIISSRKNKNFNEYINDLRIQYVLKRLKEDKKFRRYSIKHIAGDIGYKSANSFTKHFKAHTKLYPSFYIQTLNEKEKTNTSNL